MRRVNCLTSRLCYEHMLRATLNGVPYIMMPDGLSSGKVSLLHA